MKNRVRGLLVGTRQIREYCGIGVDTLYRWMKFHNFPVTKFPTEEGTGGLWVTSPLLIEEWLKGHMKTAKPKAVTTATP